MCACASPCCPDPTKRQATSEDDAAYNTRYCTLRVRSSIFSADGRVPVASPSGHLLCTQKRPAGQQDVALQQWQALRANSFAGVANGGAVVLQ